MQTKLGEVKLVIWDWFNTLCDHHLYEDVAETNPPAYEMIQRYFYENPQRISEWAQGQLSYQKIHQHFSEITGIPAETFDASLRLLGSQFDIGSQITPYLRRFKEGHVQQIVATDNFDIWDEFFLPQYSKYIETFFSGVYNSRLKRMPDLSQQQEFLRGIVESFGLPIQEVLLIDDNREYCHQFHESGGLAVNHEDMNDLAIKLGDLLN